MLVKCETKSNRVKGLSFHPKLSWILASLHNGTIQLWDYRIGSLIDKFEEHEGGPVRGICFHLSQPLFVSGGDDYKIKVWNYKLRRCIFTLLGHLDYIRTVEFHDEYPWILSASDDQTIRIWNWQSRSCIAVLTGHNHYVMCAHFHPKEDLVVSASLDQTVRVWDTSGLRDKTVAIGSSMGGMGAPGKGANDVFGTSDAVVKYVLEGHDRGVNWASFHPTLPLIVSGADDRLIKLWRMNDTKAWEVDTLRGHFNNVSCVMFHPKKELILSNSEDRTIRVWDVTKRTGIHTFRRENDRFWIITAHRSSNLIAVGHDAGMVVFKLDCERPLAQCHGHSLFVVQDREVQVVDLDKGLKGVQLGSCRRAANAMTAGLKSLQFNTYNPTETNILVFYTQDGGCYDLFVGASNITADTNISPKQGNAQGLVGGNITLTSEQVTIMKKHRNIVLCGPNAAGKTTLLYKLKLPNEKITVMPTIGFNVESIQYNLQVFDIWDLGLRSKARPLVRHYIPTCHAVALMIDVHDDDWLDAEDFFELILHNLDDHNLHVPLLIWVNKMDLPVKVQPHEVCERLKLEQHARCRPIHVQPCIALKDEGLKEGLDFLGAAIAGEIPFGLTLASTPETSKPASTTRGITPPAKPSPAGGEVPKSDEVFLEAFEAGELPSFGPKEMMRLAFLQRRRGGTAQMTLQAAKLAGYVKHATRMHFWASRVFETPLESAETSLAFLAKHPDLFPEDADAQEALVAAAYSERVDTDPTWALVAQPPDRRHSGREADAAFLARVEELMIEADELSSFRSLVRLAFTLLCQQDRKSAIKRLDTALQKLAEGWTTPAGESALRPFHETRQYVALQLAHLALTQCPELKTGSFSKLEERCPDLCDEDCIFKYYSEEVLQNGRKAFVPPDREPLPSVVKVPDQTWHKDLDDDSFMNAVRSHSLCSWGLQSLARLAYLLLRAGRREGLRLLLEEVEKLQASPEVKAGLFAHETLAYFTLHMVHFYSVSKKLPLSEPFADFVQKCDQILDTSLYRSYYSDVLIHGKEARTGLVFPDLLPLPDLAVCFTARNRFAVLQQGGSVGIYNLQNELSKKFDPPVSADFIFPGGNNRILLKSEEKIVMYDLTARKTVDEVSVAGGVRYVVWSPNGVYVAFMSKHNVLLAGKNLEYYHSFHENIRVKSGAWDENGVFVYSTLSHVKYCLPNGDSGIIHSLANPIYIARVHKQMMYYIDREQKVGKQRLNCSEYLFKLALHKRNFNDVKLWISNGRLCGNAVIGYLKSKGFPEVALHFVEDQQTRFNLALEYGHIEEAMTAAQELDERSCWNRLGLEALRQGNQQIVEMVYQKTKNFDALSFLYLITGNIAKLRKMLKIAEMRGDVMSRFHNALMLGQVEERVKIMAEMGQACCNLDGAVL
ncbi:unnamed protein product [Symbiodinium microadriaticum]|nr:unnamed protein product [Symbiodinium microadriaticum]